jgi:hypothetical protein
MPIHQTRATHGQHTSLYKIIKEIVKYIFFFFEIAKYLLNYESTRSAITQYKRNTGKEMEKTKNPYTSQEATGPKHYI